MDRDGKPTAGILGSMLASQGKSSRLQAMRDKAMAAELSTSAVSGYRSEAVAEDKPSNLSPELVLARKMIDQRLAEILASLPVGRQRRLFKIRFGVEFDRIRNLPVRRIVCLLGINHPQLNNSSLNMKRIGDLNYNGE